MAGPIHWGTRPDLIMSEAKKRAREAFKKGSPKGLTTLERGFYKAMKRKCHQADQRQLKSLSTTGRATSMSEQWPPSLMKKGGKCTPTSNE